MARKRAGRSTSSPSIAIVAMLFPVFAQAKIATKRTSALSNVERQGLSEMLECG